MAVVKVKVIRAPVVIPAVQYGVIKRDWNQVWPPDDKWPKGITHVSRPTRNNAPARILGLPATARSENTETVGLNENLQRFIHQRSCERAGLDPHSLYAKNSFSSFTRGNAYAFDFAGSGTHHDYINSTHEDADDIKNKPMLTSGAVMAILGDERVKGVECWVINAINVLIEDVWKYNFADVGMWYAPTTSRRDRMPDGRWREDRVLPFDDYHDKVAMWNFSNTGLLYIPTDRVQLLRSLDERPPIYVL